MNNNNILKKKKNVSFNLSKNIIKIIEIKHDESLKDYYSVLDKYSIDKKNQTSSKQTLLVLPSE